MTNAKLHADESAKQRFGFLRNRAAALAACAKFQAALNDTTTMQMIAPSSGMGYLCAAHVYSQQGRYRACISTCDHGLSVVPSHDPYYQQLKDMRWTAMKRSHVYVDFINDLPEEIIHIIVDNIIIDKELESHELRQYLSVSLLWRQKFLRCTRDLHVVSNCSIDLFHSQYVLQHAAPYIGRLTIKYGATPSHKLFQRYRFPSLQYLHLDEGYPDDIDFKVVLDSLATVQSTVTYLNIRMEDLDYSLGDILDTFQHLISFTCYNTNVEAMITTGCYPTLKELKLWNEDDPFQSEQLNTITKLLPALQILSVNPCVDTKALSMVQENCPNLKLIAYNDFGQEETYMERITYNGISKPSGSGDDNNNDLQSLNINWGYGDLIDMDMKDVIATTTRNACCLQSINLCYGNRINTYLHDSIDAGIIFSRLTSYTHHVFKDQDVQFALCMIRRSPNLRIIELFYQHLNFDNDKYFHIVDYLFEDTNQVFIAISGLADLQVANIQINGDAFTIGLGQFLAYHNGIDSKLRTLFIPKGTPLSSDLLKLLMQLPRLERLTIDTSAIKYQNGVHGFLQDLATQCPLIHTLNLYHQYIIKKNQLEVYRVALLVEMLRRDHGELIQSHLQSKSEGRWY
ncbi:hypothetical protein K492DRAFT_218202 [Lichtheimia hyalospora FSU 10163]|nr:hypothetical protein K492DRAFT_218202 [Lichtheimia hyalospora FSU 10163]